MGTYHQSREFLVATLTRQTSPGALIEPPYGTDASYFEQFYRNNRTSAENWTAGRKLRAIVDTGLQPIEKNVSHRLDIVAFLH